MEWSEVKLAQLLAPSKTKVFVFRDEWLWVWRPAVFIHSHSIHFTSLPQLKNKWKRWWRARLSLKDKAKPRRLDWNQLNWWKGMASRRGAELITHLFDFFIAPLSSFHSFLCWRIALQFHAEIVGGARRQCFHSIHQFNQLRQEMNASLPSLNDWLDFISMIDGQLIEELNWLFDWWLIGVDAGMKTYN